MAHVGHHDSKVTLEIYAGVRKRRDRDDIGPSCEDPRPARVLGMTACGAGDHPDADAAGRLLPAERKRVKPRGRDDRNGRSAKASVRRKPATAIADVSRLC